jgi:hypothetical protein
MKDHLSTAQLVEFLGISPTMAYSVMRLKGHRLGGRWFVPVVVAEDVLKNGLPEARALAPRPDLDALLAQAQAEGAATR